MSIFVFLAKSFLKKSDFSIHSIMQRMIFSEKRRGCINIFWTFLEKRQHFAQKTTFCAKKDNILRKKDNILRNPV
jgi:hypothetical protein